MASAICNKPHLSIKQLLGDPRAYGDIHERRAYLCDTIKLARCAPPGYTFCSLCRQLAKLSFEVGEKEDGIYNLIESHAVILRQRVVMKYHRSTRKNPSDHSVIDKKYVEFDRSIGNGYHSVLNRLQEMPEEWTIIQLSCAADDVWRFGGPNAEKWTPQVHIVRMECGSQPEFQPLHLKVLAPPEATEFVVLKEIQQMCKKNMTDHLLENKRAYWEARWQVDTMLKSIIDFMNRIWLASISPFFVGRLSDDKLRKKVKDRVHKIALNISNDWDTPLSEENLCLLVKTAENIHSIREEILMCVIGKIVNKHIGSPLVKKLLKEFETLKKEFGSKLCSVKKGPVILIIDEKLESVPFECMEILKDHPVTRVPSLHIVHGLYNVHKNTIEDGLKIVNSNSGYYMINPGHDLKAMEDRMSKFLLPRVPSWKGIVGERLSGAGWCEALGQNDIFVYMGHGSGSQYWNVEQIAGGIRSLSLLFGCKSAGYKLIRGGVEVDATLQAYQAAACPCIVGMLWQVTDKDTDLLAQAILDLCLPKCTEEMENGEKTGKERRRNKKDEVNCLLKPPTEPEVARAVVLGRQAARMLLTQAAVIVRGLPVCIK